MDSLGVWDSMRLEHCHTRDISTGAIAGRVEYRDLTYTDGTPDKTKLTPINIKEVTMAKSIGGGLSLLVFAASHHDWRLAA